MIKYLISAKKEHQRERVLAWLQHRSLTTYQARQALVVFHPSARVKELKEAGHHIVTRWATIDKPKGKHRIASYVLLSGGGDE